MIDYIGKLRICASENCDCGRNACGIGGYNCRKKLMEEAADAFMCLGFEYEAYKDAVNATITELEKQSTGLTDKNGREIRKGDHIAGLFLYGIPMIGTVDFQHGAYGVARCPACYCNMDVVIDKDGFGTEQEAEKAYDKFCELVTKRWNRRVIDEQNG